MIRAPQEPGMPKRKLVFIASLASFCSIVGYTSYSPAKAAVRQLADSLREECILYDIDVHCAFPANILTPGFEEEEKTKPDLTRKMEGPAGGETPEVVAARIIKKLEGGDEHITYEFVGTMLKVPSHLIKQDTELEYDVGDDTKGSSHLRLVYRLDRLDCVAFHTEGLQKNDSEL